MSAGACPRREAAGAVRMAGSSGVRLAGLALAAALVMALSAGCDPLVKPGQTRGPTPSPSPTFELDRTGLEGVVVDEEGEPIAGVKLRFVIGGRHGSATTTPEGTFFDRGTLGEMTITASKEGYVTVETKVTVVPNEITEVRIVLVAED